MVAKISNPITVAVSHILRALSRALSGCNCSGCFEATVKPFKVIKHAPKNLDSKNVTLPVIVTVIDGPIVTVIDGPIVTVIDGPIVTVIDGPIVTVIDGPS